MGKYPVFSDDLLFDDLKESVLKSIIYLEKLPSAKRFLIASGSVTAGELLQTNRFFLQLIRSTPSAQILNHKIRTHFDVYQASGVSGFNPIKQMLVTGYYQPVFKGSLERSDEFNYPLYGLPDNLVIKHAISGSDNDAEKSIGRFERGRFVPYWTRGEIETDNLLAGQELVWLKNPMDAFTLHIQGSGLISLPDGTVRGVHYRIRNGRDYRSIGKYMVDQEMMSLESASMDSIRLYIEKHPERQSEIFHHNESFIFFEWTLTHGAIGSLGQELTGGRSIAVDREIFPPGALCFLSTSIPVLKGERVVNWKQANRFVTVQDTGSAIKGSGRVDLFWGSGKAAGVAAGRMKEDGLLYILVLKKEKYD